jgi:isocitrate dehydrogenase (NAD+)
MIVDKACMQLVMNPEQFDLIVTTNLFGDIISDICAGLIGGLGLAPGANIGDQHALFETVHGTADSIAGKKNANPSSMILASAMMLEYLQLPLKARIIRKALRDVYESKDRLTPDMGGTGSTTDFTEAILDRI